MDIGYIANDSMRYPTLDWKKIIILGIIMIIPIVNFIGWGYLLRILKATFAGIDEQPDFDEIGELFVDGLKILVVNIAYMIIPFIVIFAGIYSSILAYGNLLTDPFAVIGLIGGIALIGIILLIIFGIFEIIALANMALYDGELGAAFRFSEILERISMIGWVNYIIWLIVMFIIGLVGGIIAGILNIIPYIGMIIAYLTVYPYLYMLYARSLALLFASSEEGQETAETA